MSAVRSFPTKEPVAVSCRLCGTTMLLAPARARKRIYCSRACARAAQRQKVADGTLPRLPGAVTDEGRVRSLANLALGRAQARERWKDAAWYWSICSVCASDFPTRATSIPRYCSARCRTAAAHARRLYTVEKPCAICKSLFVTGKYRPARTCSKSCAKRLWHAARRNLSSGQEQSA